MGKTLETNGYIGWCIAESNADGQWSPVVWFEKKADHGKSLVPATKHTIRESFATEDEAVRIAAEYFRGHAASGDTGL